jgi:hypothetical protein
MKYCYSTLIILGLSFTLSAQIKLSDQAEISVITCGPGQAELYSAFGHSAFRVFDPANQIDHAFNYGVFDFNQPNFYLNFARGHNNYRLAVQDYKRFEYTYIYYNRYVHEQVLNLNTFQKQKLFDYLVWNAQPENQYYRYDYFYDNCATKLPEIVSKVFRDSVLFDGSYITTSYSIRQLTDLYLNYQPWGDLGIDICLGLPMDKIASPYEYMFLPDYVESGFDHAYLNGQPLVKEKRINFDPVPEQFKNTWFQPLYVFSVLAVVALLMLIYDLRRRKLSKWFDYSLFTIAGLIGLLLFLLWTATDHRAAANNMNLLWAMPLHLIAVTGMMRNKVWVRFYFQVIVVLNGVLLIAWPWLPQMLHYSLIPVTAALAFRAYAQFKLGSNS